MVFPAWPVGDLREQLNVTRACLWYNVEPITAEVIYGGCNWFKGKLVHVSSFGMTGFGWPWILE